MKKGESSKKTQREMIDPLAMLEELHVLEWTYNGNAPSVLLHLRNDLMRMSGLRYVKPKEKEPLDGEAE